MSSTDIHSTGRGGAGNIGASEGVYVDGNIVREGVSGGSRTGEYSSGRGGLGNMVQPLQTTGSDGPNSTSTEIIPESAMHHVTGNHEHENYHYGRGGVGNVHHDSAATSTTGSHHHQSHHSPRLQAENILEKAKHAVGLDKKHFDK